MTTIVYCIFPLPFFPPARPPGTGLAVAAGWPAALVVVSVVLACAAVLGLIGLIVWDLVRPYLWPRV